MACCGECVTVAPVASRHRCDDPLPSATKAHRNLRRRGLCSGSGVANLICSCPCGGSRLLSRRPWRHFEHRRSSRRGAGYRICLVAIATVLELPPIGSSHAPTSCLCTGRNGSGQVALPLVVRSRREISGDRSSRSSTQSRRSPLPSAQGRSRAGSSLDACGTRNAVWALLGAESGWLAGSTAQQPASHFRRDVAPLRRVQHTARSRVDARNLLAGSRRLGGNPASRRRPEVPPPEGGVSTETEKCTARLRE
jgi:hypothetical protein